MSSVHISRVKLFDKSFLTIEYDAENKILIQNWKGFSTSVQFRQGIEESIEIFKKKKPLRLLSNTKESSVVKKEDTEWAATYATGLMMQNGLKAMAFIVPTSVFAKVSITNFQGKATEAPIAIQYFDDMGKAIDWLKSIS